MAECLYCKHTDVLKDIYDSDAELATADEIAEAALLGMVASGILQAGTSIPPAVTNALDARRARRDANQQPEAVPEITEQEPADLEATLAQIAREAVAEENSAVDIDSDEGRSEFPGVNRVLDDAEAAQPTAAQPVREVLPQADTTEPQRENAPREAENAAVEGTQETKINERYGEIGKKTFTDIVGSTNMTAEEVETQFHTAYKLGRLDTPLAEAPLANDIQRTAFNAGRMDRIANLGKTAQGGLETAGEQAYNGNQRTEGLTNEEVYLRNGSEWDGSAYSGGQIPGMAESAGGNQNWKARGKSADSGAASLSYGEAVSTSSLGITGGSTSNTIRLVTGGDTVATRKARQLARERGLRLVLFSGDNLQIKQSDGSYASVRGYISGDRVFVRVDHPRYTSDQILRHEAGHDMIAKGEIDPETVRKRIDQTFGKEKAANIAENYVSAYEGSGLTAEEIWEEVICDSLGDMNIFSGTVNESVTREFLGETKKAATDTKAKSKRGPPATEGKASRETGRRAQRGRSIELETMENNRFERLRQFGDSLPNFWYAYSGEYLYVYENISRIDYRIIRRVPVTNQALSDAVIKEVKDNAYRTAANFNRRLANLRAQTGRHSGGNNSSGNRGAAVGAGGLSGNSSGQSAGQNGSVRGGGAGGQNVISRSEVSDETKAYLEKRKAAKRLQQLNKKMQHGGLTEAQKRERAEIKKKYHFSQELPVEQAPVFYSKMEQEIEAVKQNKLGASSVVSMLRGKGVKAEEIKWSGIEQFLEGKKSVTKAELQEFVQSNQIEIEEQERTEAIQYSDEQRAELDRLDAENDKLFDQMSDNWYALFGEYIPVELLGSRNMYVRASRKLDARGKGATPEAKAIREAIRAYEMNEVFAEGIYDEAKEQHNNARWKDYTLEGGANYREYLFKMPGSEYTNHAMKAHWGSDNTGVLAHARVQDFTHNDEPVLFIEEIQSDWHNAGQKQGYQSTALSHSDALLEIERELAKIKEQRDAIEWPSDNLEGEAWNKAFNSAMAQERTLATAEANLKRKRFELKRSDLPPDAPYAKTYHEYVLKNLLRKAAEGGYSYLAWTPAEMQEERWSSEYAEGYRIEYEQDIPKFLNKYGKQWGAHTEDISLDGLRNVTVHALPITDAMKQSVLYEGQPKFSRELDVEYQDAVAKGDTKAAQKMVDEAARAKGYTIKGHHGTTNLFTVFDTSKSNIENDWGRGIYATTSEEDAETNYAADDGADLTNRIERLAEMMENWEEYEDMDYEQRVEAARNQLSQGENRMLRVAIRMENPVVVERGDKGTFFTYESEYDEDADEYSEPSGTLLEVVEQMQSIIEEEYEWASYDADNLNNLLMDAIDYGGMSAIQLQSAVDDALIDVYDEDGNLAGKEILRAALERMGFDGIIDKSVPYKFGELSGRRYGGMRGVTKDTTHYIAFNSSQVKLADAVTFDDNGDVIPLSQRFNSDADDIRFSRELDSIERLRKSNESLREVNKELREQFKTTKFAQVDKKSLDAFTKKLLQDYQSGADINETRDALNDLYTYMANGEDGNAPAWNEVQRRAYETAVSVLEGASTVNDDLYREYKHLRDRLRNYGMTISPEYDQDLMGYESINEFRKANFGRIKLVKNGTPVDVVYQDLASAYPEFFDDTEYTTQADQLTHIAEVLDSLQPYEVNPYSYNMRESATWLANDIIERFYELPQAKPTFADKAQQKLTKQVIKDAKKLERVRDQKNERIAKLIERNRERIKETQAKERAKREKAVEKVRESYKNKELRSREARTARELRERIAKHAASMSKKLLRPTDKSNVPQNLRFAVATLLDAINLESNYTYDPQSGSYKKSDDGLPTRRTDAFREVQKAYQEIIRNGEDVVIDPALLGVDAEGVESLLGYVIDLKDIRIADMNTTQLETIWKVLRAVEASVNSAGRMLAQRKYETTKAFAEAFADDTASRIGKRSVTEKQVSLDLLTPYTFFSRYGQAGKDFFRMLRDAQDRQQVMQDDIVADVQDTISSETKAKLEKETVEVVTARGEKLTLTKAQAMEIYLLSKREQARNHLINGGIIQPKAGKVRRGSGAVLLNEADVGKIIGTLTAEERGLADKFQKLTGKLAAWGNKASVEAYGYEKFNDSSYWPIKAAPENHKREANKDAGDQPRAIQNMGAAKPLTPQASNTLEIRGMFDTFDAHMSDMLTYSAWLIPMLDANRLFNFEFVDENGVKTRKTMSSLLNSVGGPKSDTYWMHLMKDIQNGIGGDRDSFFAGITEKTIGNVKKASVAGNIRVVVQQPTSIVRAAAVLDPDNIALGIGKGVTEGRGWEKAVKYAPIAARKAAGGFEMASNSAQLSEYMYKADTKGGKVKEAVKASPFYLAGKADEITWGAMWNASEWQIARTRSDLQKGSAAFYEAVAELFTDTIDQTQVVDGILQRSQIMRSSNALSRQMTNFMGEPIMTLNVAIRAYETWRYETDGKKRTAAKKVLGRSVAALLISSVTVAFAQSLWDAVRDDDEEKDYWERVWAAFSGLKGDEEAWHEFAKAIVLEGNAVNAINPANMIPYVNDAMSIIKGFTVERMDAGAFGDFISAAKNVIKSFGGEGKWTPAYATAKMITTGAKMFGSQSYNVMRDAEAILRTALSAFGGAEATADLDSKVYNMEKQKSHFVDLLYQMKKAGDAEAYDALWQEMVRAGITPSYIESGIEKREDKEKNKGVKEREFSANALSRKQQKENEQQRNEMLENIIDEFQRRGFGTLDEETADALLDAAYTYAENVALLETTGATVGYETKTDASGKEKEVQYIQDAEGRYDGTVPKWVLAAQDADELGMTPAEYLWVKETHDASITADGVYDAYEDGVVDVDTYLTFRDLVNDLEAGVDYEKGDTASRQAAIKMILMEIPGLTQDEYDDLYGTEYKAKSGFGGGFGGSFGGSFGNRFGK